MNKEKRGNIVGQKAMNFKLFNTDEKEIALSELLERGPVILCFYPGGPIKPMCTSQFCDYRDNFDQFKEFDAQIIGISSDSIERQKKFAKQNNYPFTFLMDPKNKVAKLLQVKSFFLAKDIARAIVIINQKGIILYRYSEPTFFTRKGSKELIQVLRELRKSQLL
jgi:peroxiredoxin Q/BCP